MRQVYDANLGRTLLCCGRQTEKSTLLGNTLLTNTMLIRFFRSLYVSPSQQQTETFSKDRITDPLLMSGDLAMMAWGPPDRGSRRGRRAVKKTLTLDNVLNKKFITGSEMTFRYAFHSADRVRGIRADDIKIDEIQDINIEFLPIIEECSAHSEWKLKTFSGTPKTIDNTLNYLWENHSTRNEWAVPCDACNHWNILFEKNIGKKSLICSRCGKQIYANHERAQWASDRSAQWLLRNPLAFNGYRISQLMVPWLVWDDILDRYQRYPRVQFYNEVLGRPYDSSSKAIPRAKIMETCRPSLSMENALAFVGRAKLYMGIDWGTGENSSFTVVTVGGYMGGRFQYIYAKRFTGEEAADIELQIQLIKELIHKFKPELVGVDYGGGFAPNSALTKTFTIERIFKFQYNNAKYLHWDHELARFMVNRTAVLMDFINAFNELKHFTLPRWEEWEDPFSLDMESVLKEYTSERNGAPSKMYLSRVPSKADDTLHSMLYCFLAATIQNPRPDIIRPTGFETR